MTRNLKLMIIETESVDASLALCRSPVDIYRLPERSDIPSTARLVSFQWENSCCQCVAIVEDSSFRESEPTEQVMCLESIHVSKLIPRKQE